MGTPAVVSHAVHATPLLHHAVAPVAPLVHHAVAPAVVAAPAPVAPVVGLTPHDCVTEAGCSLRAALVAGLPSGTFGSAATTIVARKKREAEAEAEPEADPYYYSSVAGHGQAYSTFVDDHPAPVVYTPHPFGYNYGLPYGYNYGLPYSVPAVAATTVVEAAPAIAPHPIFYNTNFLVAPQVAAPAVHAAAPLVHAAAPVVHAAPLVKAAPVVETVSKPVTYTHLGAHPIQPTTVIQTESRLI